jgi:hypothetical protein
MILKACILFSLSHAKRNNTSIPMMPMTPETDQMYVQEPQPTRFQCGSMQPSTSYFPSHHTHDHTTLFPFAHHLSHRYRTAQKSKPNTIPSNAKEHHPKRQLSQTLRLPERRTRQASQRLTPLTLPLPLPCTLKTVLSTSATASHPSSSILAIVMRTLYSPSDLTHNPSNPTAPTTLPLAPLPREARSARVGSETESMSFWEVERRWPAGRGVPEGVQREITARRF